MLILTLFCREDIAVLAKFGATGRSSEKFDKF